MNSPKSYRLLASGEGYGKSLWYVVSVETIPSAAAIKALVCEVVRSQKPVNYRVLGIGVYVGLDSWVAPVGHGDTEIDRKQYEHCVANYAWNVEIPDGKYRLHLVRESRFEEFDHLRACNK